MTVQNPWTRHFQSGWENRAANTDAPLWARLVSLAYGRHEANGHANFTRGDLLWILGTPAKDGQPFKRRHSASIRDAIEVAVKYGWLAEGSCNECLIVPSHEIEGPMGNADKPCPVHERKRSK
ncbi:MAG: hypothetical protein QOH54_3634 [Mycobacterium sp.]|nr:hypothetical protein [Mycobacterium sp.]